MADDKDKATLERWDCWPKAGTPESTPQIEVHAVHDNGRPPDRAGGQHTNGKPAVWVNVGGVWYRSQADSYKTRKLLEELMELGEFTKWEGW